MWYDEVQQIIQFLKEKRYEGVDLIGSSGGALVAITDIIRKIGNGRIHIFQSGCHLAMLSNRNEFVRLANDFFEG